MKKLPSKKDSPKIVQDKSEILHDASVVIGNWDLTGQVGHKVTDKIAVIGDKDCVFVFKGLGVDVFSYTHPHKVRKIVKELVEKNYAIILITEREAEAADVFDIPGAGPYPIIVPIPNGIGKSGYGLSRVQKNIAKAVGG